jgi:membrane fusion protein (multidrug efflux system)
MTVIQQIDRPVERRPRRRRGRGRLLAVVALVAVAGVVVWGIVSRSDHVAGLQILADEEAVPQVQVIHPAPAPATRTLDLPGNINA